MAQYLDKEGLQKVLAAIKTLIDTKANSSSVPTKVSDLNNDSNFVSGTKAEGDTAATGIYDYIDSQVSSASGDPYTVSTTNNSITSGSTTYNLVIDENTRVISLSPYTALGLSLTSNVQYEIDDQTTSRTVTATVTGTNKDTAVITWSGSDEGTTTGNGSTMTQTFASATESTLNASVTDGKTTKTASTKVTWAPRVMWLASTDEDLASINVTANNTVGGYNVQTSTTITNKKVTLAADGYIYFAVVGTPSNYYLSNSDDRAAIAGGFTKVGTFPRYTSLQKTYNLYRSTDPQQAGTYRIDVV